MSGTLKEVNVETSPKEKLSGDDKINTFSRGQKITHIDSVVIQQYKFQSMANLLSQQTPAFIKSYGFNGLATLNFRGSSAAQSQVFWNGIPLQNAALGIADISTLPVAVIDKVNIVYGSSAALWGSGNVGGALMLENDVPVFDSAGRKDIAISLSAGSFRQYSGGAKVAFGDRNWSISANAFVQSARNDFSYTNSEQQEVKMDNSRLYSLGFMLNGAYRFGEKNVLSISGWYQHFDREIPAALFERYSLKDRVDQSRRLMLHWNKEQESSTIYFKSSIIEDKLSYNDHDISIRSSNTSYQFYNELGWKKRLGTHYTLLLFTPLNYSWMKQASGNKHQLKTGLSGALSGGFFHDRLHITLLASEQIIDTTTIFLPGLNASIDVFKWLVINGNVQRTYRVATLNELYYEPGGNPDLRPERGWTQELGYSISTNKSRAVSLVQNTTLFNRDIKDWILWFGGAIWTPHNIAKVNSRGVETENMLRFKAGKYAFHLGVNTAYIIATTRESDMPNDASIGKQIPYSPRYNGQMNLGLAYRNLYINYNHTYTGYRFFTTDESAWIMPYNTANLQVSYMVGLGRKRSVQLSGQCNNLLNARYQVVAQRPMPGANWLLGARFNLSE